MKIGIVTTNYPRFIGDHIGEYVFNLATALRKLGHHVHIIAPECSDSKKNELLENVSYVKFTPKLSKKIAYGSGIVENIKRSPFLLLGLPGFISSFEKFINNHFSDCNIIEAYFTATGIALARLKNTKQLKVYYGHGSDIHLLEKSILYRFYFKRMLSKFDVVTVVSKYLAEKLIKYQCCSNPIVIPNGISEEPFNYYRGKKSEYPIAIYASRMIKLKRPILLIKAWLKVTVSIPDAKLIMFGDGPLLPKIKRVVKNLGISDSVIIKGNMPIKSVWEEMGHAWLTVLPSEKEGFGIILLESLAVGTPFLSSSTGAAHEIADNTGGGIIIDEPFQEEKLAKNIISAFSNKEKLLEMGKVGREVLLKYYSWSQIAEKKIELYNKYLKIKNENISR